MSLRVRVHWHRTFTGDGCRFEKHESYAYLLSRNSTSGTNLWDLFRSDIALPHRWLCSGPILDLFKCGLLAFTL